MFTLSKEELATLKSHWERVDEEWKRHLTVLCEPHLSPERIVGLVAEMTKLALTANQLQMVIYKGDPSNDERLFTNPHMGTVPGSHGN